MKIVKVEWTDSVSSSYWVDSNKIELAPVHIVSFGVLFKDTPGYIAIMQNFDEDANQVSNYMSIPKGCITKIEEL